MTQGQPIKAELKMEELENAKVSYLVSEMALRAIFAEEQLHCALLFL